MLARKELRKWMPQGIDVQVPSLTSPGTEQLEADDVMALARESNDLLPDCRPPGSWPAQSIQARLSVLTLGMVLLIG